MSLTQDIAALVGAAEELTEEVSNKIATIDQRVVQFESDSKDIVATATASLKRAKIGVGQQSTFTVNLTAQDDAGALVKQAFNDGHKHVSVYWSNDGQDRHWNTLVAMPIGTTLYIHGPACDVDNLGGSVRAGRGAYARGKGNGTSDQGSPLIFKNLEPSTTQLPENSYFQVMDETSLITMGGNNSVQFGEGTFVYDTGGMTPNPYGNGLFRLEPYIYDMPCFIGGGGHNCQFYLGGPLLNNCGATSVVEIRFMQIHIVKLDSDGPALTVNKGFKKLLDNGVSGVTSVSLNKQNWEVSSTEAAANDNQYGGANYSWYLASRGSGEEIDRPRIVTHYTWAFGTGWTLVQINGGVGELSYGNLVQVSGRNLYLGTYD